MTTRCITTTLIAVGMILLTAVAMMAPTLPRVRPQPALSAMTTVILVRHAEKKYEPGNPDPDLTDLGRRRARNLAKVFANVSFDSAIATQFKRTQQTIDPICESQGIGRVTASAGDSKAIAEHILENCNGTNVFVAGHSNTVPAIMRALGVENPPRLTEDDYNDVFIITIAADRQAMMLHLKIEMGQEAEPAP